MRSSLRKTGLALLAPCALLLAGTAWAEPPAVFDAGDMPIAVGVADGTCDAVGFHLSARVLGTPNANEVFLADAAGMITGSYAEITGAREDAWGYRDGAYDGDGVYFGWGGGLARHNADGTGGALVCPNNTGNTTIRALAYDPRGTGSIWTADFGSALVQYDPGACAVIQSFPVDGWSLYGLAFDDTDGNLWGHTTGGTVIKIDTTTGLTIVGAGWPTGFANLAAQGGLSAYPVASMNAGDVAAISQGTPDELGAYDTTGALVLGPVDIEIQSGTNGHLGVAVVCAGAGPCGQCEGDVNNDGVVNVFDLLFVLDNWGPVPPGDRCADINNDQVVNVFDLLAVLDNWGPCPVPPQACCLPGGVCMMLPPLDCVAQGGMPQGAGTTCMPNPCTPPPTIVEITAMTVPNSCVDMDNVGPAGPTTVAAINAAGSGAGANIVNITFEAYQGTIPLGNYNTNVGRGRALGGDVPTASQLTLIDPQQDFGSIGGMNIILGQPSTEFGFSVGDWNGPFRAVLFAGAVEIGFIDMDFVGGPLRYLQSNTPFDRVRLQLDDGTGSGNWVVPDICVEVPGGGECFEFGGTDSTFSGASRMRGNMYSVSSAETLTEILFNTDFTGTANIWYYVYEGTSSAGPFTKKLELTVPHASSGLGFYSSGPISVDMVPGRFYGICCAWQAESLTYLRNTPVQPRPWPLGNVETQFNDNIAPPLPDPYTPGFLLPGFEYRFDLCFASERAGAVRVLPDLEPANNTNPAHDPDAASER